MTILKTSLGALAAGATALLVVGTVALARGGDTRSDGVTPPGASSSSNAD